VSSNQWSSRLIFIITTSAFAVGLGNIWRFPYIAGEGGGGAFLLIYLALAALIGMPILLIEMALGRMSRSTPVVGFGKLSNRSAWNAAGWLGVAACTLILCYYVMIMAWIVIYGTRSLSSTMEDVSPELLATQFDVTASSHLLVIVVIVGIMMAAALVVSRGLQAGLERYSKWMMIALIILILGLAVWAATLNGAGAGYRWYLLPDFSRVDLNVVLSALGQLFFSLGVAMAVAFVFGSYTSKNENLISSTAWIVFIDTLFAFLAGMMIFPAIFTYSLAPDSGPNLIFVTMTAVFAKLSHGQFLGATFFLLMFLAGFTSLITCMQGIKACIAEKLNIKANSALAIITAIITLGSIPVVFSYTEDPFTIFGFTMFELFDDLTSKVMLPLGGLCLVLFGGYVVGYQKLKAHITVGAERVRIGNYWSFIIKIAIPTAMIIILINGLL